jgi:hypothetical protein
MPTFIFLVDSVRPRCPFYGCKINSTDASDATDLLTDAASVTTYQEISENNDSLSGAKTITVNSMTNGHIDGSMDLQDYFKLEVTEGQQVYISLAVPESGCISTPYVFLASSQLLNNYVDSRYIESCGGYASLF